MKALACLLTVAGLACAGCGGESGAAYERKACALMPGVRHVPEEASVYEVTAAPDTVLTGCSDGTGMPQPFDEVVAPFPAGGPDAEAIVAFKLPRGGCYEVVSCTTGPTEATAEPLD